MGKRSIQLRVAVGTAQAAAITGAQQLVTLLADLVYTSVVFNGLRYSEPGTNISNPVQWSPINGQVAGVIDGARYPRFMTFVGRSPDGRKVRFALYGIVGFPDNDYRTLVSENAGVSAVVAYLNNDTNPFRTISGLRPVWKQYVNQGYNAYFQRRRRAVG